MAADMETSNRSKAMIFALCKRLSLDPSKFSSASIESGDLRSLFSNILKLSGNDVPLANQAEVMKWVEFASNFPCEPEACFAKLEGLNEDLASRAVLLGSGFQPSEADIVVFSALHSIVIEAKALDDDQSPPKSSRKRKSRDADADDAITILNAVIDFRFKHSGSVPTLTTMKPIFDAVKGSLHHELTFDQHRYYRTVQSGVGHMEFDRALSSDARSLNL